MWYSLLLYVPTYVRRYVPAYIIHTYLPPFVSSCILPHPSTPSPVAQRPKYHFNHHSGPVLCLQRSPFFKDIVLSVGGWSFAVWKEGCEVSMLPRYSCMLTHAHYLLSYVLPVHPCTYIHTYMHDLCGLQDSSIVSASTCHSTTPQCSAGQRTALTSLDTIQLSNSSLASVL